MWTGSYGVPLAPGYNSPFLVVARGMGLAPPRGGVSMRNETG